MCLKKNAGTGSKWFRDNRDKLYVCCRRSYCIKGTDQENCTLLKRNMHLAGVLKKHMESELHVIP